MTSNGRRSRLRRLDAAVVPRLQRGARAVAGGLGAPWRALDRSALGRLLWAGRQGIVLLAALVAFTGSYFHLQWYPDRAEQGELRPAGAVALGGDLPGGGAVVGPVVGESVRSYLTARRTALAEEEPVGRRLAVVTFSSYRTPQEVLGLLPGDLTILRAFVRVPSEEQTPRQVGVADSRDGFAPAVSAALAEERTRVAEEEHEFRRLLDSGTVNDPAFAELYRAEVDRLSATRNLVDSGVGTVFAVLVRGPVKTLQHLTTLKGIRLVDLAPGETDTQTSSFYGILPEDKGTVSYGARG